ncbi:MAG: hypothetical protein DRP47_10095 [Candidatus Zixiibacteriota bacterium]|nr:MAG: hypothetical protein DRP47_10095 [candidate division Zixibacteria bacterium]
MFTKRIFTSFFIIAICLAAFMAERNFCHATLILEGQLFEHGKKLCTEQVVKMTLRIYDDEFGGNLLFEENQEIVTGSIKSLFTFEKGDITVRERTSNQAVENMWVEVESNGQVMVPRLNLSEIGTVNELAGSSISMIEASLRTAGESALVIDNTGVTFGSLLNMGTQSINLGGESRNSWPEVADHSITESKLADGAVLAEILDDDGPGSGLDADTLDGNHSTDFAGSVHGHAFSEITGIATDAQITDTITRDMELGKHAADSSAHHSRYSNTEAVAAMDKKADTNPLHHDRFTSTEAISAVLAADGAGSTLDADLLDGQHASEIIDAAANAVRTAISSLPYTISSPGSYYITGDLTSAETGIIVTTNYVTIDLMGYSLIGSGSGSYAGISMWEQYNVEIKNGTVRNFGSFGIIGVRFGLGHRVINVRSISNGSDGIFLGGYGHTIKDCSVIRNEGYGINAYKKCTITGNIAYGNKKGGIRGVGGCTINGNTVGENNLSEDTSIAGIVVLNNCMVKNNTVCYNKENNIYVFSDKNVIEENLVVGSTNGINFFVSGNFYANNRASGNTNNYVNTAGQTNGGGNYEF